MAMKHVYLTDVRSGWQRIFAHAKSGRIGEVGAELAHELEDARILGVPNDGESSFEGSIRCERPRCTEWSWVALS